MFILFSPIERRGSYHYPSVRLVTLFCLSCLLQIQPSILDIFPLLPYPFYKKRHRRRADHFRLLFFLNFTLYLLWFSDEFLFRNFCLNQPLSCEHTKKPYTTSRFPASFLAS